MVDAEIPINNTKPLACTSLVLRRFRWSLPLAATVERQSSTSAPSHRSSLSSDAYDNDEDHPRVSLSDVTRDSRLAHERFLRRVEAVRFEHSIRKFGHRFYVVHVYLTSHTTPIYRRDADYALEYAYASCFALRDRLLQWCGDSAWRCAECLDRASFMAKHDDGVHDVHRALRSAKEKQERLEKFIHFLLWQLIATSDERETWAVGTADAMACDGCDRTLVALSRFLKRKMEPSTGLI